MDFDQMEEDWLAWKALENQEDLESDYVASEDEGPSGLSNEGEEISEEWDSEEGGDSEYPDTGDELYPIDTDDGSDSQISDAEDIDVS